MSDKPNNNLIPLLSNSERELINNYRLLNSQGKQYVIDKCQFAITQDGYLNTINTEPILDFIYYDEIMRYNDPLVHENTYTIKEIFDDSEFFIRNEFQFKTFREFVEMFDICQMDLPTGIYDNIIKDVSKNRLHSWKEMRSQATMDYELLRMSFL